jgi:hypothetical protein
MPTMTKLELIAALTAARDEALATLRGVPAETYELGRYENGWNGREILAHVASIEWTYPKLIEVAQQAPADAPSPTPAGEARRTSDEEGKGMATRPAQGGILSYNDRQVAKRAAVPIGDLIDEFEKNRNALIAAVESADDELLARPIRSAGGITGALADVINTVANGHVRMHVADLAGQEWTGARF